MGSISKRKFKLHSGPPFKAGMPNLQRYPLIYHLEQRSVCVEI